MPYLTKSPPPFRPTFRDALRCAVSAVGTVLIGVVVLEAVIAVVLGHLGPLERPAITRAMRLLENVVVVKGSPIHQLLGAAPHGLRLLASECLPLNFKVQFLLGEESEGVDV